MALCDILECTPNDLIEPVTETVEAKATGTGDAVAGLKGRRPRRVDITEP